MNVKYYPINEDAAKRAKAANSFFEYVPNSATTNYKVMVDEAAVIAEKHKAKVDPMYHEKIDYLFDKYARELAEVINKENEIDARVPSILIAGGSNFPVHKKEKQNAARRANEARYNEVHGILDKIKSVGTGGIMSDDKNAIAKLTAKLEALEKHQAVMKAANVAVRMKDTEKGNEKLRELGFSYDEIQQLRKPDYLGRVGYPSFELTNNNANIHRIRERIANLEKEAQRAAENANSAPIEGYGYKLVENAGIGRIQFIFDSKPNEETRTLLKSYGFRWAPSESAWQRMLNDNGRYAAQKVRDELDAIPAF